MKTVMVNQSAPCQCSRCKGARYAAPVESDGLVAQVRRELAKPENANVIAFVDEASNHVSTFMAPVPYFAKPPKAHGK